MNENPWHVDDLARVQRERVQEEMRQIRLEERALNARGRGPGLLLQTWMLLSRWLQADRKHAGPAVQLPTIEPRTRPGESHI